MRNQTSRYLLQRDTSNTMSVVLAVRGGQVGGPAAPSGRHVTPARHEGDQVPAAQARAHAERHQAHTVGAAGAVSLAWCPGATQHTGQSAAAG
jgi:hypothetical protein